MVAAVGIGNRKYYVQELRAQAEGLINRDLPILPLEFIELIPTHCPTCETPLTLTETYSRLECPSLSCGGKAVQRLLGLINDLGVLDMGEAKCKSFFNYYGVQNPYAIFALQVVDEYGNPAPDGRDVLAPNISHAVSKRIIDQVQERKRMALWEYVKIGNYKSIRDRALALFGAYDSLDDFYAHFENGDEQGRSGVAFVQAKLGISNTTVSISAIEITETLQRAKEELYQFIAFVDITKLKAKKVNYETGEILGEVEKPVFNICISRAVGYPFKSKQDFVYALKERFDSKFQINVLGGVTPLCNVLIWSGEGTATSKVRQAFRINENSSDSEEPPVKIMTGQEFIQYLEELGENYA